MDRRFILPLFVLISGSLAVVGVAAATVPTDVASIATPNTLLPFALLLVVLAIIRPRDVA